MAITSQQLKSALDRARTDTKLSTELNKRIQAGNFNQQLQDLGVDVSSFGVQEEERGILRKTAGFLGGEKLATATGQQLERVTGGQKLFEADLQRAMDLEGKLLQRIKERKSEGADTTRLEEALTQTKGQIKTFAGGAEERLTGGFTDEEIIGDAVRLASLAVGGAVGSKLAPGATGIKGLAKVAAGTAAAEGALQSAGFAIEEGKDIADVTKATIKGGLVSGLFGLAAGGILGGVAGGRTSRLLSKTRKAGKETAEDIAGKIAQTKKGQRKIITKGLSSIDTEGIKTYDDLIDKVSGRSLGIKDSIDEALDVIPGVYKTDDLVKTIKVGDKSTRINYVEQSIDQLDELYRKTNDPEALLKLEQIKTKLTNEGLNVKEINDLSRLHGSEFGQKAFSKVTGEPLTSVNAQAFENTRTGIKATARDLTGDFKDTFIALDGEISTLIKTESALEKVAEQVVKLQQRVNKRGLFEKAGRGAFNLVDTLTGGFTSGVLRAGLVPRGGGLKTLNALDLEKQLSKTLNKLIKLTDDLDAASTEEVATNLIKKFEEELGIATGLLTGLSTD